MQVSKETLTPTKLKLTITADQALLDETKKEVLTHLSKSHVKIEGFRNGKAPLSLVERQVDQSLLQSEFLESAVNRIYLDAITEESIRPVSRPEIAIAKFVPFTTLEITAEVEAVGEIKLADYKKIKLTKKPVKITDKDLDEVISNLKQRAADKEEVTRASKDGDEVMFDFAGVDAKTKEAIDGADGKDYPLVIGSKTFIPGFEEELIGLKAGADKEFTLTFPKDYGVSSLKNRKVTFTVTVKKVQKVVEPKIDDAFAAKVGPFKTVAELKEDIKKQLQTERENQANRDFESELLEKIAEKSEVAIPDSLIDEELERMQQQDRQNATYRGQTWEEYLKSNGLTEEEYKEKNRPAAALRIKAGLILSEVADKEQITVTKDELELRLQLYKGQYQDESMLAELDKPEARREIVSRLLSEKTIDKLASYATSK